MRLPDGSAKFESESSARLTPCSELVPMNWLAVGLCGDPMPELGPAAGAAEGLSSCISGALTWLRSCSRGRSGRSEPFLTVCFIPEVSRPSEPEPEHAAAPTVDPLRRHCSGSKGGCVAITLMHWASLAACLSSTVRLRGIGTLPEITGYCWPLAASGVPTVVEGACSCLRSGARGVSSCETISHMLS